MSYTIESLPGEAIVLIRIDPSDHSPESAQKFAQELTTLLDAQTTPVYLINIMPAGYSFDMTDLLEGTRLIRAQTEVYRHANVAGLVAVTRDETLKAAYQGLSHEAFGGLYVTACDTLDEALAHARKNL